MSALILHAMRWFAKPDWHNTSMPRCDLGSQGTGRCGTCGLNCNCKAKRVMRIWAELHESASARRRFCLRVRVHATSGICFCVFDIPQANVHSECGCWALYRTRRLRKWNTEDGQSSTSIAPVHNLFTIFPAFPYFLSTFCRGKLGKLGKWGIL